MNTGVELAIDGRVAQVRLSRPASRNAFDTAMLAEMEDVIQQLGRERGVDVVVLRGDGPTFCAGTDLKELAQLGTHDTLHWQRRTGELVERWARLEATTLTAFNGPAIGSGAIVGLASDLRVAADSTYFAFPELGFGIPLTWSGVSLLTALIGADRTKRVLLLQERIEAAELMSLGLVMDVLPAGALDARVEGLIERLLATSPLARSMTKRAVFAASAAPGFSGNALDPFLAALGVELRGNDHYLKETR